MSGKNRPKVRLDGLRKARATRSTSSEATALTRSRLRNSRRQSPMAAYSDNSTPVRAVSVRPRSKSFIQPARQRSTSSLVTLLPARPSTTWIMTSRTFSGGTSALTLADRVMTPGSAVG